MKNIKRPIIPISEAVRLIAYGAAAYVLAEFLRFAAAHDNAAVKFGEHSYVEFAESLLLVISGFLCLVLYKRKPQHPYKNILFFLTGVIAMAFFREQDVYFEEYLGHSTWQIPVIAVLGIVLFKAFRERKYLRQEFSNYTMTKSYAVLSLALVTIFIFSRLFGRSVFWKSVMETSYSRTVKNVAEESLELYGYLLFLFSIIELAFHLKRREEEG